MSLRRFIEELEAKGAELWVEDGRLRYRGAKDLLTAETLGRLKENKAEVISLQRERAEHSTLCPLSTGQLALWFLHQLAPASPAYNVGFAARIHSPVDVAAMRRALESLAARHVGLRATFPQSNGAPVQELHKRLPPSFETAKAAGMAQKELMVEVAKSYQRPFDLEKGPLLRAHLFTCAEDDHVLSIAVHHLVCDAWSLWLLLEELGALYHAETKPGSNGALPALAAGYPDFVRWQLDMLAGPEGEELRDFWKNRLAGELPVLNLPTDRPRPAIQTFNGSSVNFQLSPALTAKLKSFASAEGATLYTVLLAAFEVLLHRYSGQEEIILGSPTSGRTQREFADVMGDFINTVVLRSSSAGDPSFRGFLAKTSELALDAIAHQNYPFPLLVDQLRVDRDPSRSPIFQVLFNFQKPQRFQDVIELWVAGETGQRVQWGGLSLGAMPLPQQEGQFDVTLEMIEGRASLFGVLKYNTDLFDQTTIVRMAGHFETLLQGIVSDPATALSRLPLLTEPERHQLLVKWNGAAADYPRDKCVHEIFEAQAAKTPQAVAVACGSQSLTYAQLNAQADNLAASLRSAGVGPDSLVGLCVERSVEMLVGLLGILKAGGAYIPLDPSHPRSRLDFILADAGVGLLCTQERVLSKLQFDAQRVQDVSPNAGDLALVRLAGSRARSAASPAARPSPDNLAYVIFTSGSTGQPKGVQIIHRAVVNFLCSMALEPGLSSQDILLALTTLSFDIAALELLLPLSVGARVVIARREEAVDPERLAELIKECKATVIQATPATWRLLLDSGWPGSPSLKLLVGGEALPAELAAQLLPRCGCLWNMYGPTETTIWSAVSQVVSAQAISIGKPIANTELLVLQPNSQLAPIGVAGELHIGGDGLARGYLGRPELTKKAFLPHPFSDAKGARLYKTGDLVRYRADRTLEFIGRVDHQVKIRGYRVELGEIETAIRKHPEVKEAVVLAREDAPGDKRLVAYYIPVDGNIVTSGEWNGRLGQILPDYMVPSAFIPVQGWPLTGSGKIDRRALPKPEPDRPAAASLDGAPQTPAQKELTAVWSELLGIENPRLDDNLFHVGGHSLIAVRLAAKIKERFAVKLSVAAVFQHPTIRELSAVIDARKAQPVAPPAPARPVELPKPEAPPSEGGLSGRLRKKFDVGHEGLVQGVINRIFQLVARLAPAATRTTLHRWRGVRLGEDVLIGYDTIIETSYPWLVSIGSHSAIGMRVTIIGHFLGVEKMALDHREFSVEIGKEVWIGPGSLILPNVTIGDGAVVAAGSVVSSSVPPETLVQGNPARAVARCPLAVRRGRPFQDFVKNLEPLDANSEARPRL
ncbi:MAG TPA: amino acid adenylation domain-containing protein [Verrucomicrobiae bacterium]|jgi:amino acid adenylation domain-containing protein